jgi:speckle-type POZ protein
MPAPDFTSAAADGGAVMTSHLLDLDHYWKTKQLHPNGQRITSAPFEAGGFSWRIHYYPNGISPSCRDYISIFVALDSRVSEPIKVWSRFTVLDFSAEEPMPGYSVCTDVRECSEVGDTHGCDLFVRKRFLETSGLLLGLHGCSAIAWDIFVDRAAPQPDFSDADVTFLVGGEEFSAHSSVLAARSPAFKAELNSATRAAGECIRIDDMLPEVFDSLLDFVYTDSLPEMTGAEESTMAEHLLVAADRFGMQDLKVICEEQLLWTDINEDTIAKMLKLAVQHNCSLLRDACIEFLEDPPVLQAVMANGDGDLLELVAKTCPAHLKELWVCDEDDCMQEELAMYL